jgi:monoamine oxidase
MPVAEIHYSETGGRVVTADGTEHEADFVVLAVPPSTWSKIAFAPELPGDFRPSMGPAIKVLAPVDAAYWEKEGWSQYGIGDGAIAMTWDGTYHQAPPSEGGPAGLVGFSGAQAALDCLAVPEAEREAFFAAQLDAFFPGYRDHATGKAAFIRWPQDPWTLTGYSVPTLGKVTQIGPRMAQGFGRLRFAGEHASWSFFGYMEGALRSGVRLARSLAEEGGA